MSNRKHLPAFLERQPTPRQIGAVTKFLTENFFGKFSTSDEVEYFLKVIGKTGSFEKYLSALNGKAKTDIVGKNQTRWYSFYDEVFDGYRGAWAIPKAPVSAIDSKLKRIMFVASVLKENGNIFLLTVFNRHIHIEFAESDLVNFFKPRGIENNNSYQFYYVGNASFDQKFEPGAEFDIEKNMNLFEYLLIALFKCWLNDTTLDNDGSWTIVGEYDQNNFVVVQSQPGAYVVRIAEKVSGNMGFRNIEIAC